MSADPRLYGVGVRVSDKVDATTPSDARLILMVEITVEAYG